VTGRNKVFLGVGGLLAFVALGAGGGVLTILNGVWTPEITMDVPVTCPADTPELPKGEAIRALVWNIQFSAGRANEFFYDGGPSVSVTEKEVVDTLDAIGEVIARFDPDIVILQEVDRDSRRTHYIDQHEELLQRTPYACHASTPYFKGGYVPHPPHEHLGQVDMHLAIFSKYKLGSSTRHQLPLLKESWIRQQFNLKRALMETRFPIAGGGTFLAYNTHLAAFSRGDGTLEEQTNEVERHLASAEKEGIPWLIGADFNALPPGDDPVRLGTAADLYAETSPITSIYEKYNPGYSLDVYRDEPKLFRTWIPYGSERADRALDYVFTGANVDIQLFGVMRQVIGASDHHPLLVEFTIQ